MRRWETSVLNLHLCRLDAEWISAKKHWQDAQKRAKEQSAQVNARRNGPTDGIGLHISGLEGATSAPFPESESEDNHEPSPPVNNNESSRGSAEYQPEMDDMRCILYAHGGMNPSPPRLSFSNPNPRGLLFW